MMLLYSFTFSQDIHFSQFWTSPLNLNPSYTGQFDGDYRFTLNNKNQWLAFANAYSTFAGSFDAGFENVLMNGSKAGLGLQINNDIAGDGRLATNQFMLSTAYSLFWNDNNTFSTSFGFSATYTFNSVNFNNFRFGSQYILDQFDPNADPQEVWQFERINYLGLNAGVSSTYIVDDGFNFTIGAAAYQVNRPQKSFFEDSESFVPIKWSYNLQGEYHIKDDLWAEPYILFMHQQKYKEFLIGGLFRFDYNPLTFRSIYMGGLVRSSDAGIFLMGVDYQNVKLTINYDVNFSKLTQASRGRGGIEFSIVYIIMKPRPFEIPYYRKCPDFM